MQPDFQQAELDHLSRGGTVYHFGATWHDSPNSKTSVILGPFFNAEAGEDALAMHLLSSGYRLPKWWEYWRWGENRPSKRVLDKFNALVDSPIPVLL